jgi:hypothetical protein
MSAEDLTIAERFELLEARVAHLEAITGQNRDEHQIVLDVLRKLQVDNSGTIFTLAEIQDHFKVLHLPLPVSAKKLARMFLRYQGAAIGEFVITDAGHDGRVRRWLVRNTAPEKKFQTFFV